MSHPGTGPEASQESGQRGRTDARRRRRREAALLAIPLLGIGCVLSRWLPLDTPPLVVAAALTPAVVPVAAITGLAAVWRRRPVLAWVSGVCLLVSGTVIMPRLPARGHHAPPAGVPLTLVTANVYHRTQDVRGAVATVMSQGADFILLQEVSPAFVTVLEERAGSAGYAWTVVAPDWGSTGLAVLSRHPVVGQRRLSLHGQPLLEVDVSVARTVVRLFDVHIEGPVTPAATGRWRAQLDALRPYLDASPGPLIAAGDFNATLDHRPFRRLLRGGRQDVAAHRAGPWLATWSERIPLLPPLLQLDHVVTSSVLVPVGLRARTCPGSDHRLLAASIVMKRSPQRRRPLGRPGPAFPPGVSAPRATLPSRGT